ncbi:MAG: hypothetical protein V1787_04805 [Candidatus Micrarchaeota archaeon]
MDAHHAAHPKEEKHFSASLAELKREEELAAKRLEQARKDAEKIVLEGREESQGVIAAARKKAAEERQKLIDAELKKIQAECDKILAKAERDAAKIRSDKEPKKAAAKLLPLVLGGFKEE